MDSKMDQQQLNKAKEEVRLTQLEIDSKIIRSDIHHLRTNHLKHIEKSMDNMDKKIEKLDTRVWAILFSIVCLAASNVMSAFFG